MTVASVLSASTDSVLPFIKSFVPGFSRGRDETDISDFGAFRTVGYRAWPENPEFESAWRDLVDRVPEATVFHTPDWQRAVLAWPQRLNRLLLLAVWSGPRLVAVLPLQQKRGDRLESAGAILSDYLDPLIDPAEPDLAWSAILGFLREHRPDGGRLVLRNVRPHSSICGQLIAVANEHGFCLKQEEAGSSSYLSLPGSWDEYLAGLKSGDRKELKRKLSKAQSQARASLVVSDCHRQTCADAQRIFSWIEAGGGERGMKCRWLFRSLLSSATGRALAERKWMRVFSLNLNDKPAAGIIAFRSNGGWMTWATGYDAADKTLSPGIVTFAMTIKKAIEEGASHLDLLRGHTDYKARLGGVERPLYNLVANRG